MSYCRFSSDDFTSDVYVYADVSGGYTTHVASSRYDGEIPSVASAFDEPFDAERCAALFKAQDDFLDSATMSRIGGAHDGKTYNDPDLASLLDRLCDLQGCGYRVPQSALDEIRSEMRGSA